MGSHHRQGSMKKLADHVEFPERLDFRQLKHLIFESDRQRVLIDAEYDLYAVLVHSGPQLGYGHYYALIKSSDGQWFRMNDMDVIPVSTKHVLREQGYMVFYKRKTDNLMKCHLRQIKASHKKHIVDVGIKIKEQKENEKQIQAKDEEIDVKVNTDLLTTDYFANNCNAQQDDEQIVIVDT